MKTRLIGILIVVLASGITWLLAQFTHGTVLGLSVILGFIVVLYGLLIIIYGSFEKALSQFFN